MSASAIVMGLAGFAGTFLPEEILLLLEMERSDFSIILFQVIGGMYLGFAMLNWFTRSARIGGIYNRPIVLGNLLHFVVVAFALVRQLIEHFTTLFVLMFLIYLIFAVWFGLVLRSNPLEKG